MDRRPVIALAAILTVAAVLLAPSSALGASLPPAGDDTFVVVGQVAVTSRLGSETIALSGNVTVARQAPHMEGSVEVVDMQITALSLTGQSQVGEISVAERTTPASTGELRGLSPPPDSFPALSFFDIYVDITVPTSPGGTLILSNTTALHLAPPSDLVSWPPNGVTYSVDPDPCLSLFPTNPYGACIDSLSVTLSGAAVGGLTELVETDASREAARDGDGFDAGEMLAGAGAGMVFAATAWYLRRRLQA